MLCENGELIDVPLGQRFVCKLGADEIFKPEPCKYIKWCAIKHAYEMLPGYENKCENISS